MNLPPEDLLHFLRAGRQLEYDVPNSTIGAIKLKSERDLKRASIDVFPGCQLIIEDPYGELDGMYCVDAFDLVLESERYDPEGLLCWIPSLGSFASVDAEHGTVIKFPNSTWSDIVTDPSAYLDAQWELRNSKSEVLLPWLHFPFKSHDAILKPYPPMCPIHEETVITSRMTKPPLFAALQRREKSQWVQRSTLEFPCSGVPLTEDNLLYCKKCLAEEEQWMNEANAAIVPIEVKPNAHGWIKCPSCDKRFKTSDTHSFVGGVHLRCGQKITITT